MLKTLSMDYGLEMQQFLPVERRPSQEWPWCKGFIVQGVLYSSHVTSGGDEKEAGSADVFRSPPRSRASLS